MTMGRVNSYDRDALLPKVGTRWIWQIDSPSGRELIMVTEVFWNGEEWWVRSKCLMRDVGHIGSMAGTPEVGLTDVGGFWEAVTPVGGTARRMAERRPQEAGGA